MDFEQRLQKAIQRGERTREMSQQENQKRAATEEELHDLHTATRIELSEYMENCLKQVGESFPGFQFRNLVSDEGWGGKITRDDLQLSNKQKVNVFSRFEIFVRPYTPGHLIDVVAKSTIRNKELFNRHHFQQLSQLDLDSFRALIDLWVLEFAEAFARSK
jgi:hypothetical protein